MKMLNEAISRWINKLFVGLIEPVSAESINVSAIEGRATLENLTIRPSCMAELGLPVVLNAGTVGSLVVDIPVTSLRSKPIRVAIRDVLISFAPNPSTNVKKAQLEKQLLEHRQAQADRDAELDPNSKIGQIFAKIADNFILSVENVHFRFEDTLAHQPTWEIESHPERCFSLGITMDRFELRGVVLGADGEWEPRCVKDQQRFLNKTVVIGTATARTAEQRGERALRLTHPYGLGVYLQHGERPLACDDMKKWKAEMRGYIAAADDPTDNDWIFGPMSVGCKVSVDTQAARRKPARSRVWATHHLPTVARKSWVQQELTKSNVATVAVQITSDQIDSAGKDNILRLCWAFQTEKDDTGFEVLHFADLSSTAHQSVQAAAVVDCHHERARGGAAAESGVFLLRWTNVGAKRRASSVRYTLWMESTHYSGDDEPDPQPCTPMSASELNEFLKSSGVSKLTIDRNIPKDSARPGLGDQGEMDKKYDGAQTELDVRTGLIKVNLHQRTLLDLMAMQTWYSNVERWRLVSGLRPTTADGKLKTVSAAPRSWWQFAINATVEFLPSHIFRTKLRGYVDGALEYEQLFKRKHSNAEYAAGRADGRPWHQPLRKHEAARLDELEEFLPLEMVTTRRERAWLELQDDQQYDEIRRRDVAEAESNLLTVAAEGWTARPAGDQVMQSSWGHFEGAKGKPKRQWLVLAEVQSEQPTRYSGWLNMHELLPETVEVSFAESGSLGLAFADPDGIATIKVVKEGTQAKQHPELTPGMVVAEVAGQSCAGLSYADCIELIRKHSERPLVLKFTRDGAARLPKSGERFWFRLKGSALSYYPNSAANTQQAGMIGLDTIREARQIAGSADTFELVVGSGERCIQLSCDTFKQLKQWVSSLDGALNYVPVQEDASRWLMVYNKPTDIKAAEALPLRPSFYALEAPRKGKSKKGLQQSHELCIALLDGSVRRCVIGCTAEDAESFLGLMEHLEANATETIIEPAIIERAAKQLLSADDDVEEEQEDDEGDEQEIEEDRASSPGRLSMAKHDAGSSIMLLLQKIELHIEQISISLGVRDAAWLALNFKKIKLSTSMWEQGVTNLSAIVQEIEVEDLYTRDSAHPQLMCRIGSGAPGCEDDPMLRILYNTKFKQQLEATEPGSTATYRTASASPKTPSSAESPGSVGSLNFDFSPELETYVQAVMQPTRLVLNSSILPVMSSFLALREKLSKMRSKISASAAQLFRRFEEMTRPNTDASRMLSSADSDAADGLGNSTLTNMRALLKLHGFEAILPDDLSIMQDNASCIVFRTDTIQVANSDYRSPRLSARSTRRADAKAGWSQRDAESGKDGIIPMAGHARSLEVFCCHRDDHSRNRHSILQPVTANISLSVSAVGEGVDTEWMNLLIALDSLDLQFSTQALKMVSAVMLSASRLLERRYVSNALMASAANTVSSGTHDALDEPASAPLSEAGSSVDGSDAEEGGLDAATAAAIVTASDLAASVIVRAKLQVDKTLLTIEVGGGGGGGNASPRNVQMEVVDTELKLAITHSEVITRLQSRQVNVFSRIGGIREEAGRVPVLTAKIPFGVCQIAPTLDPGAGHQTNGTSVAGAADDDSLWLYNQCEPNKLVRFTSVKDLMQVKSPGSGVEEITQLLPLLTVAMRMATLKAGVAALTGGAAPAAALAASVWNGMDELYQQAGATGDVAVLGTATEILDADLAEAGMSVGRQLLGEELFTSLVPTVRYIADCADRVTAAANKQVQSRLGPASAEPAPDDRVAAVAASAQKLGAQVRNKQDELQAKVELVQRTVSSTIRTLAAAGGEAASAGAGAGAAVSASQSDDSVTIRFGGAERPGPTRAAPAAAAAAAAVEAADFGGLGTAELELLCSCLGAEPPGGGPRGKEELLRVLKVQLVEAQAGR